MSKADYLLMYKDEPVLQFNLDTMEVHFQNRRLLPFCIRSAEEDWSAVRNFCATRMLMTNRKFCKEILTSCGIDNQTDINICIVSKALSFRDNYWIRQQEREERWEKVNLYKNPFSEDISNTALTGEAHNVHIGDELYTGELTNRGTRAKCYIRMRDGLYLAKAETNREISAEIVSYVISSGLGLPGTMYFAEEVMGKQCSICRIETSEENEMIPARDVLKFYDTEMKYGNAYYTFFLSKDPVNFIKMQVFDYLTLNTDRNRDNFALRQVGHKITGLFPIFDHDSCFKGKSDAAVYFVTGKTFAESMELIRRDYHWICRSLVGDLAGLYTAMEKMGERMFTIYNLEGEFVPFMERVKKAIIDFEQV